ncbi:MAG: 2-C-methyl-D-erythritol 4-phosphate cytidylyltransferase [Prevotellaceae bacterium]|jgi:2-C-methyl-D-erythritol 4-phosphate cytidylyltransferase|nr:2-C-methyl-D-erythritol 4-phosphate cytidylyltransferase [Prevotellaceae bacterium]
MKEERYIKYCIIVAGGSGLRMGVELPKQFIELRGKPVLMHTMEKFYHYDVNIQLIVALPKNQQEVWGLLCTKHSFTIPHKVADGGITRFHSVKNALKQAGKTGLIAVHDGVRPLVSVGTIKRCFDMAEVCGTAVPTIPMNDSVREVKGEKSRVMDRSTLKIVQTPQVFKADLIRKAYLSAYLPEFTDDASVVEYIGEPITLVEGNVENVKLTYPSDIIIAEALLL